MIFHMKIADGVFGHAQVASGAAHPAALTVEEILPDPSGETVCQILRGTLDYAAAYAAGFLLLVAGIHGFRASAVFHAVGIDLMCLIGRAADRFPVGKSSIFGGNIGTFCRGVFDDPCGHRNVSFADTLAVAGILVAVQHGAVVLAGLCQIVSGNCGTADGRNTCIEGGIGRDCHVCQDTALADACSIDLGLMDTEVVALSELEGSGIDISRISVRSSVGLIGMPYAVFRLQEGNDQFLFIFLLICDPAPFALTIEIVALLIGIESSKVP